MTKKDYELIARTLFGEVYSEPGVLCEAWENGGELYTELVQALAESFAIQNERFDREKFIEACGL
jgi:hypothetical protein